MSLFGDLPGPDDAEFDGDTYEPELDAARLTSQLQKVHDATLDRGWLTLFDIHRATDIEPRSISARLRDLRKEKFGAYVVDRRAGLGANAVRGVFEYRVSDKGGGIPQTRAAATPDHESALRLADQLARFLRHIPSCSLNGPTVRPTYQCTCGLDALLGAYQTIRRRTRQ